MHLRDMAERLVERCARCFSDPAERLQFLRRATAPCVDAEAQRVRRAPPDASRTVPRRSAFCASSSKANRDWRAPSYQSGTRSRRSPLFASSLEVSTRFAQAAGWSLASHNFARKLLPVAGLAILITLALAVTVVVQGSS